MIPGSDKEQKERLLAAAMRRLEAHTRRSAFDPIKPESRPNAAQQLVLDDFGKVPVQYIVSGNQGGKSTTCARLVSWVLEESHPDWTRPADWANEPLLILVCGRTGKQLEESLLPKILSYLDRSKLKEVRVGNMISRLEHENGNRIVFQSLENANQARERIQSYVAHLIWIDEMPPTDQIIDEALRRVQARSGYLMASFTPLVENVAIQKRVDAAKPPYSRKYKFSMLDNPIYQDPQIRQRILEDMALLPESIRNTRLYGDWSSSDLAVYYYDYTQMSPETPSGYNRGWRHVESVDPALKSALGYTLWGEDPATGKWYLVVSDEIRGILDPETLVETVRKRSEPYNVVRRVSDPHEVWYIQIAAKRGIHYTGVYKKNERKGELIKQFQQFLGSRVFIPPHNTDFIDQLTGCKWADGDRERIVAASSKHLLDSAMYFCDNIPKWDPGFQPVGWEQQLRQENDLRIRLEARAQKQQEQRSMRIVSRKQRGVGVRWNR